MLPGFTVSRRLGSDESAMWLATEDATGRVVTLRHITVHTPALRERLHAGTSLMRQIDHPHIVPLFEARDVASGVVVVCGAAAGGSLADVVGVRGTLPPGEVVTACAPIAEALAELHPHGILHGAITLDDIVFSLEGRPMLAGVGMAQLGAPTSHGHPGTLAPEIAAGSPPSPGSDVYSLAAVAVVGLTGYLPRLPLSLPDVPPAIGAAMSRALERAPERRLDSATLSNALYAIADPQPVEIVVSEQELTSTGSLPQVTAPPPSAAALEPPRAAPGPGTVGRGRPPVGQPTGNMPVIGPGAPGVTPPPVGTPGANPPAAARHGAAPADDPEADEVAGFMRGRGGRRARRGPGAPEGGAGAAEAGAAAAAGAGGAGAAAAGAGAPPSAADDTTTARRQGGGSRARRRTQPHEDEPPRTRTPARPEPERPRADRPAAGRPTAERPSASRERDARPAASPSRTSSGRGKESNRDRGSDGASEPKRGLRRIDLSRVAMVLAILLLAAGAVVVAREVFGDDEQLPEAGGGTASDDSAAPVDLCGGPQPAPTALPAQPTDWTQEVQRLYTLREQAFEELDAELLCQVHAPTNPVLAQDVDTIQAWADADIHAEGLTIEVVTAELVSQNNGVVVLEITDRQPAYQLVDEDGEVVEEKEGTPDTTWQAELVAVADEAGGVPTWRFG